MDGRGVREGRGEGRRREVTNTLAARITSLVPLAFVSRIAFAAPAAQTFALDTPDHVRPFGVNLSVEKHEGKRALQVVGIKGYEGAQMALLDGSGFKDGTIEAEIAGEPVAAASETARGFVGIAFHSARDGARFECFYLRPTNGRAEDQVRRNHSVQYIAYPGYEFDALRKSDPGRYESYVDLVPGAWTHVKIVIDGRHARLFVHGASQPTLVVNDLKLPLPEGETGLWIGDETQAWFRDVKIRRR